MTAQCCTEPTHPTPRARCGKTEPHGSSVAIDRWSRRRGRKQSHG